MSSTDELMSRALAALGEMDGPMSIEVIHRLADTEGLSEPMTIAEVADLLDVSAHTLRYYERAGLVEVDREVLVAVARVLHGWTPSDSMLDLGSTLRRFGRDNEAA